LEVRFGKTRTLDREGTPRLRAGGRVIAASGVVLKRSSAVGRVEVACRIGEER
jgi:hypothetical protein